MRGRREISDATLSLDELKAALHGNRAITLHFSEIRERLMPVLPASRAGRGEAQTGAEPGHGHNQLLVDAAALVGYLQLALCENERLVSFLLELEEAGRLGRQELGLLMGLRDE